MIQVHSSRFSKKSKESIFSRLSDNVCVTRSILHDLLDPIPIPSGTVQNGSQVQVMRRRRHALIQLLDLASASDGVVRARGFTAAQPISRWKRVCIWPSGSRSRDACKATALSTAPEYRRFRCSVLFCFNIGSGTVRRLGCRADEEEAQR